MLYRLLLFFLFFFNDTATTEIYTLSLHDALPIYSGLRSRNSPGCREWSRDGPSGWRSGSHRPSARNSSPVSVPKSKDRKSTRLNSSHSQISYAVFCLKKKKKSNREMDLL